MWPQTIVQTCIIHLICNTLRLASKRDWDAIKRDVKPICTAPNATAARAALDELAEKWGDEYGAIIRSVSGDGPPSPQWAIVNVYPKPEPQVWQGAGVT